MCILSGYAGSTGKFWLLFDDCTEGALTDGLQHQQVMAQRGVGDVHTARLDVVRSNDHCWVPTWVVSRVAWCRCSVGSRVFRR